MYTSAHQFIDAKGAATVAQATARSEGAVRVWKHRNRFPREVWPELMAAYPEELPLETLRRIETAPKPKKRAAA